MTDETVSLMMLVKALDSGASGVFNNIGASMSSMADKAKAASVASASGADAQTAAFARVETSSAKAAIAQDNVRIAADNLATAQKEAALSANASADEQEAAASKVAASQGRLTLAQDASKASSTELSAAQAASATASAEAGGAAEKSAGGHQLLGVAALGAAAGIGIAAVKSVEAASSYNQSSVQLSNTASISTSAAKSIGDAFLATAGQSTFSAQAIMAAYTPVSGELGEVAGHALSTKEAMSVMSAAMTLAESTGMSLNSATTDLANNMKLFHLNAGDASTAANTLYNTSKLSGIGVDTINTAVSRLAPALAGTGITMQQTGGLILDMTNQFGNGRKAIGMVGTSLQALTEPSSSAQKAMAAAGLSFTDATGKFIGLGPAMNLLKGYMNGTAGAASAAGQAASKSALLMGLFGSSGAAASQQFADLQKKLEGASGATDYQSILTDTFGKNAKAADKTIMSYNNTLDANTSVSGKAATISAIFGKNAQDMTGIINGGSAALQKYTDQVSAKGAAESAAQKNAATLEGEEKKLSAIWNDMKVVLGEVLLPMITQFAQTIMSVIGPIASWIGSHEQLVATILKVVIVVGTLIGIMLIMAKTIEVVNAAMLLLAANPVVILIMAIVIAVVAVGVAIAELVIHWNDVWNAIKAGAEAIANFLVGIWNSIYAFFEMIWNKILDFAKQWWPLLLGIVTGGLGLIIAVIIKYHDDIFSFIQTIWHTISDFFTTIWNAIYSTVVGYLTQVKNAITDAWTVTYQFFETIWNTIYSFVVSIWTSIFNTITSWLNQIYATIQSVWNTVFQFYSQIWNTIYTLFVTEVTNIANFLSATWNAIYQTILSIWNAIAGWLSGEWTGIKNLAQTAFNAIATLISGVWDNIKTTAASAWGGIVSAVQAAWNKLTDIVKSPLKAAISVINIFVDGADDILNAVGLGKPIHDIPTNFANGGVIPGFSPGSDTIPAMLSPGEGILTPHAVKGMGGPNGIHAINSMFANGGVAGMVQYFADGGTVVSGGTSGGVFRGQWKSPSGTTYQDITPPGSGGSQTSGTFVDVATLTGYVNGSGTPLDQAAGLSIPGAGIAKEAIGAVGNFAGGIASAVKGLAVGFLRGALDAAAHAALDPVKAAVGALPQSPLFAALPRATGLKAIDGIFGLIDGDDNKYGKDPAPSGGIGNGNPGDALAYAIATFKGLPYTWGNNDCSGIVQKSYSHIGVNLPRTSSEQWGVGTPVDISKAVPGDLAFYNPGDSGAPAGLPGHVGFVNDKNTIFDAYNTSKPIGFDPISLPGNTFMGIKHVAQVGGGGGGTTPSGSVADWIDAALSAEGWPTSWAGDINTIIQRESGGNPNAVNNSDSNAAAGTPSEGLMQVILPTFNAYKDPKLSSSMVDPVANIVAAVKYILSRYGSVAAVSSRPGGYEVGAWDTGYEAHMAMIHPGEMIIPAGPAAAIRGGGGLGGGSTHHHWHLDGTFMDDHSMQTLMQKIDRHFVQKTYPGAGYQARI